MKRKIKVMRVGKPTTDGLTDFERVAFYITLLARIQELSEQGK